MNFGYFDSFLIILPISEPNSVIIWGILNISEVNFFNILMKFGYLLPNFDNFINFRGQFFNILMNFGYFRHVSDHFTNFRPQFGIIGWIWDNSESILTMLPISNVKSLYNLVKFRYFRLDFDHFFNFKGQFFKNLSIIDWTMNNSTFYWIKFHQLKTFLEEFERILMVKMGFFGIFWDSLRFFWFWRLKWDFLRFDGNIKRDSLQSKEFLRISLDSLGFFKIFLDALRFSRIIDGILPNWREYWRNFERFD